MASEYARNPARRAPLSPSTAAARIIADSDSGYAGSTASNDGDHELAAVPILNHEQASDSERRQWASQVHQLYYNQNRVALGRSINRIVETLKTFQKMNTKWPAHYPSVQRSQTYSSIQRTQSSLGESGSTDRRLNESVGSAPISEPRLVTPQIAQEFNVLKLDLKLGALSPSELVHSLEKSSVASLLDGKISQSVNHLLALRERIEDTASKVLVTGDLNAGKSTFCNALLRKKVLPEDQQPCTNIFCEVLDSRENSLVEEVHAIPINGARYNRLDESTYDVYPLDKLEDIVIENDKYSLVKIYVEDVRSIDQSLLNNGVVDIALIDAPGLNLDSLKTTAVFARQEEIDVVVFVVSAENHFTLSAKEFIWNAAHEKAYIFIVVNRFDNIRDKARCQRMILDQVASLSPRTHHDAKELVHFVSSNAVIDGTESGKVKDFENLEQNLRSFVLEKRARSKLAPAKTYLLNVLGDLETLAQVNNDVTSAELEKVQAELMRIKPAFEQSVKARLQVSEDVEKNIDDTCNTVYTHSREEISGTIEHIDDAPVVKYSGVFSAYAYAEETKKAMLQTIQATVTACEEFARSHTTKGVCSIKALGLLHLGDEYIEKAFRPEVMFSRKKDALAKKIKTQVDFFDFFDFERQEQVAGVSMSLTVATVAGGQLCGVKSWIDGFLKATRILGIKKSKKLIIPALAVAAIAGGFFLISDISRAVPRKLAKKIRKELADMDYVHGNSERISKECRKVLKFPAEDLRGGFQRSVEKQEKSLEEKKKMERESEIAAKYFGNLLRESRQQKSVLDKLDLEGQAAMHSATVA